MTTSTAKVDVANRGWNEETEKFYDWYFSDSAPLTWGIFEPGVGYSGYSQLFAYEDYFDYEISGKPTVSKFTSTICLKKRFFEAHGLFVEGVKISENKNI